MFTYYSGLFLHGGIDDIRRTIPLEIFELAALPAMQFLLYTAYGAAPDYCVGSLHFEHVNGRMLFWLLSPLVNVLRHFGFYKIAERMRMDPVLAALAFHQMTEVDCSSSGVQISFLRTISPWPRCMATRPRVSLQ